MSALRFPYVLSTISSYEMTSVVLFLTEAWISLFTLGPIGFPTDSAMDKTNSAWIWSIISMQSQGKYFLQSHLNRIFVHLHGFVSKVPQLQLSKSLLKHWYRKMPLWRLVLDKDIGFTWTIVNAALGTTSGYRYGDYLKRAQFPCGGHSWIPNLGVLKFLENAPVWKKCEF